MRHLDPDRMVLLARGESSADEAESSHLVDCATCHNELDAMRHIAELGTATQDLRGLPPRSELAGPSPRQPEPGGPAPQRPEPGGPAPQRPEPGGPAPQRPEPGWALPRRPRPGGLGGGAQAPARPTPERRAPRSAGRPERPPVRVRPPLFAVAAALVGVTVAGTLLVTRLADRPPQPRVTARAELSPPPAAPVGATGAARVLTAVGQPETLHLQVDGLPPPTGYYQVWLIDPSTRAMFPLGALGATRHASLPLPGTVDLSAFRDVDVSAEEFDNNAAHSGTTVLRGTLAG